MTVTNFPFSAVSGQPLFKLALILAAINPSIGGVLVTGPRGSAKSTLARGLADILPNEGRALVTLPLAASEEMVVGTLDLQKVLNDKSVAFSPGLLAKAHQGILYVDEVNLLPDGLVDLLLDVATSGVNRIERDGISHAHEAEFLLLGTMNPDEGELRPQLLDRFGLCVNLDSHYSIEQRMDIVKRRQAFDAAPQQFIDQYQQQQDELSHSIVKARGLLETVACDDQLRKVIAERCFNANVDGLRADIVWFKAALAHAAWQGRKTVSEKDILAVENLVLNHRRNEASEPPQSQNNGGNDQKGQSSNFSRPDENRTNGDWGSMPPVQQMTESCVNFSVPKRVEQEFRQSSSTKLIAEKNSRGSITGQGKIRQSHSEQINWCQSLSHSLGQWPPSQWRFKSAKQGLAVCNIILLDTSGSTLQKQQFAKAKGVVLQLAEQAYKLRQQLCIFGFGDQQVSTLLTQQKAPKKIKAWLDNITASGGTPIKQMLLKAQQYQRQLLKKLPSLSIVTYLITDGRTTERFSHQPLVGETVVIDIEDAPIKRGRCQDIAFALDGHYVSLNSYAV